MAAPWPRRSCGQYGFASGGDVTDRTARAVLALSAGRRVSTDRLVDLVWDENPSESARDEQRSASLTVQDEIDAARAERGWVEVGRALQPGLPDGYWQPVDD